MLLYVTRRLLQLVPLLLVISAVIFALLYSMPGDPLYRMLQDVPHLRPEDYERLRKLYGFDDPVYVQYWKWLWQLILLNPGYSREYGQPVFEIIWPALKNTLVLTFLAVAIGKTIAILLGIFSAVRQYSVGDYLMTGVTFIAYSIPAFWLGLMLIIVFSVKLGWLPTSGLLSPEVAPGSWEATIDWMKHLILPVAVLAISEIIQVQRFMRSSMLEVLRQDYLTTARAKGLSETTVIGRHALKNALDSGGHDYRGNHAARGGWLDGCRNRVRLPGYGAAALHVDYGKRLCRSDDRGDDHCCHGRGLQSDC